MGVIANAIVMIGMKVKTYEEAEKYDQSVHKDHDDYLEVVGRGEDSDFFIVGKTVAKLGDAWEPYKGDDVRDLHLEPFLEDIQEVTSKLEQFGFSECSVGIHIFYEYG